MDGNRLDNRPSQIGGSLRRKPAQAGAVARAAVRPWWWARMGGMQAHRFADAWFGPVRGWFLAAVLAEDCVCLFREIP